MCVYVHIATHSIHFGKTRSCRLCNYGRGQMTLQSWRRKGQWIGEATNSLWTPWSRSMEKLWYNLIHKNGIYLYSYLWRTWDPPIQINWAWKKSPGFAWWRLQSQHINVLAWGFQLFKSNRYQTWYNTRILKILVFECLGSSAQKMSTWQGMWFLVGFDRRLWGSSTTSSKFLGWNTWKSELCLELLEWSDHETMSDILDVS